MRQKQSHIFATFVPVLTTLCMLGLKFLELFCAFLWAFLGFSCAKGWPFQIFTKFSFKYTSRHLFPHGGLQLVAAREKSAQWKSRQKLPVYPTGLKEAFPGRSCQAIAASRYYDWSAYCRIVPFPEVMESTRKTYFETIIIFQRNHLIYKERINSPVGCEPLVFLLGFACPEKNDMQRINSWANHLKERVREWRYSRYSLCLLLSY